MTPFQQHVANWKDCQLCPLHRVRRKIVLCKGTLPADVLFIGEGPGDSEDRLGEPFVGPAGKLLDKWIAWAGGDFVSKCWTNLVACIPKDDNPRRKTQEPLPAEIASCWPRLDEFIDLCRPKVIVAVGGLAEAQAKAQQWSRRALVVPIVHPAAVLKMGVGQKEIPAQRAVVKLRDTFDSILVA